MYNNKESPNYNKSIYSTLTTLPSRIFSTIFKGLWQASVESKVMAVVSLTIILSAFGYFLRDLAKPFYTILYSKVAKRIPLSPINSISTHNLLLNRL